MLLTELLAHRNIILASNSPRRKEFLEQLGINFTTKASDIDETYPIEFLGIQITDYIAVLKANAISNIKPTDIVITSDTIVWHNKQALGKPKDREDAFEILKSLSGNTHEVITSVCLKSTEKQIVFNDITEVTFNTLSDEDILYYIDNYKPYDKAGAYGIQEWIGLIGIEKIKGSYTNVVGLPMEKLYKNLIAFVG